MTNYVNDMVKAAIEAGFCIDAFTEDKSIDRSSTNAEEIILAINSAKQITVEFFKNDECEGAALIDNEKDLVDRICFIEGDWVEKWIVKVFRTSPEFIAEIAARFICLDCSVDTFEIDEYYMVHDHIWMSVASSLDAGMLCIGCLEKRLNRSLAPDDFTNYPINHVHGSFQRHSIRLADRILGRRYAL